jgi:hypothetical protein
MYASANVRGKECKFPCHCDGYAHVVMYLCPIHRQGVVLATWQTMNINPHHER